jgi:uncharacterized protein DUF4349/putative zinc finger protein
MSDHAWILENLAAYLTGGLEPAERERLEQHMAECGACAAALNDARAMDAALSGLFAEARPNSALEDRMIQTLRTRPLNAWRLPVPAWLAIAAAALVLISLTGAMASQILLHVEGVPNGSMEISSRGWELGESRKDVAALAAESRQRMLSDIDVEEEGERTSRMNSEVGRKSGSAADFGGAIQRKEAIGSERFGRLPAGGSRGALMGESPPPPPGAASAGTPLSTSMMDGSARAVIRDAPSPQTLNFGLSSAPASGAAGIQPFYYEPSKQLEQGLAAKDGKSGVVALKSLTDMGSGGGQGQAGGRGKNYKEAIEKKEQKAENAPPPPDKKPQEQAGPRKIIIRTGEIEYEVQSFDAAVATITRLVKNIKGGFIATVNSDKLANGKVRGSVVVRVPPENLDELILELRTNLGKSGELKNQRIGSLDITKQYTDLESELKAARAMEERLLQIIKTGKGEIKDLLAAEKELGNWRTRIEKIEGELRYYANQVALSTLTITLYEKEITAPFAIIEREQVQMGIEVEEVDQALQAAQKAVREAKGRITRAELKQPSQGQFTALLDFEVAPDAAGPLRDRLKQLGTVARFDISRLEETQGGAGKPSDGKTKRSDTRFHVHFYNLTDVQPRETVFLSLACVDVEMAMKTLLARVEKAAGRVLSSNLTSTRGAQTQGDLQFQVKTNLADAVLEDLKSAGEVMALQVRETTNVETTRKKRGFQVKLWALEAATARETDEMQLACADVAASYRIVQEAVLKAKGRVHVAQLNEQDRRQVTATLHFEVRRADEDGIRAALLKAGAVYTRKVSRAADAENAVDSKVRWQVTFLNQVNIPPRETYVYGIEVIDVDQAAAMLTALAGKRDGRTVEANISRERSGRVTGKLIFDVPMAEVHELLDALKSAGTVRVQQSVKHPEVPDSSLAIARLDVTLSNTELIVPSDDGFGPNVRRGLSDSFAVLSWSLRILILGLCVLLPWALVIWAIYRLVIRLRRRTTSTAPAA